jgi:hypothetical protein
VLRVLRRRACVWRDVSRSFSESGTGRRHGVLLGRGCDARARSDLWLDEEEVLGMRQLDTDQRLEDEEDKRRSEKSKGASEWKRYTDIPSREPSGGMELRSTSSSGTPLRC